MKPVFTIFAFALIVCSSSVSAETARQADIERKSANVMPFSMGETHHIFTPTANGGTQVVMVMDGNPKQLGLVRSHLRKEAIAFAAGNFTDPATLHGAAMPGPQLVSPRMHQDRCVHPPVLFAVDLEHEYVVQVIMRVESAR